MDMEKNIEQNAANGPPPPYSPYSGAAGYSNQVFPESSAPNGKGIETGYNPAQTGLTPVGYASGQDSTNQQTTHVYIEVTGPLEDPPPHYLVHSILNLIFCCWIFGIVAIMKSVSSRNASMLGMKELAVSESREARKWNIITLVGGLAFWVAFIVTFCVLMFVDF